MQGVTEEELDSMRLYLQRQHAFGSDRFRRPSKPNCSGGRDQRKSAGQENQSVWGEVHTDPGFCRLVHSEHGRIQTAMNEDQSPIVRSAKV